MAQIYRVGKDIFDASTNQKIANPNVLATQYKGATEIQAPNLNVPTGSTKILNPAGLQGLNESQLYRQGKDIYKLPSAISSDMITGGTAPTIKPVEQSFTDTKPYVAGLDTTTKGLESLVSTALAPTPQEAKITPITSKITELTGEFKNKPVDYQAELDKYGFKTNVQDLQNLNTQIASKKAEYDSAIQSQEGRTGLAGSIYGRQALLARQSAVELGGLSSMAQALQGNVQMAQNIADKTIAIKYEPVEQEIANQKFQLEQVYEQLSRDEKKKADALKITLDERQRLIDTEKETEANINKIMTAAAQNGADTTTLQKIMSAKDVNQAVLNAGQYLAEAQSGQPTEIGDNLYYDPSTQSVVTGEQLVSGVVIPKSSRLAFVNNNPGNLRFVGQAGASQGEGGFARFESPEAGYEALKNQIALDASRGLNLEKFINKYAPPSENNTNLYIQQAVATLGVDKGTKLSDINLDAVAQFMANKESGTKISTTNTVNQSQQKVTEDGYDISKFTQDFYNTDFGQKVLNNEEQKFNSFKTEQIVKDFNVIQNKQLTLDKVLNSGVGGPGDLMAVFDFMKALDPNSVVRESEYATAAKSGNIFAGALAKFNGYLKEKGGFLPENVKKDFISIVNQKVASSEQQYNNLRGEYRKIAYQQGLNPEHVAPNLVVSNTEQEAETPEKSWYNSPEGQAAIQQATGNTTVTNQGGSSVWNSIRSWFGLSPVESFTDKMKSIQK